MYQSEQDVFNANTIREMLKKKQKKTTKTTKSWDDYEMFWMFFMEAQDKFLI